MHRKKSNPDFCYICLLLIATGYSFFVTVLLFNFSSVDSLEHNNYAESVFVKESMPKVFVGIASYRDWDCKYTIHSIFNKSEFPDRIRVGIFQQNDNDEEDCLSFQKECPYHEMCQHLSKIRIDRIHSDSAKGPVYARAKVEQMVWDEKFYLQIDSHMYFIDNWDSELISIWESLNNEFAVLSTYPKAVTEIGNRAEEKVCVVCETKMLKNGMLKHKSVEFPIRDKPYPTPFTAAGFLFHKSHRVKNVPYDPHLPFLFDGEEFSLAARMWTAGYDFYAPGKNIIFHVYWDPNNPKPRFWETDWQNRFPKKIHSEQRVKALLGISHGSYEKSEINKYNLGSYRSLDSYLNFLGLDDHLKNVLESDESHSSWNSCNMVTENESPYPGIEGRSFPPTDPPRNQPRGLIYDASGFM